MIKHSLSFFVGFVVFSFFIPSFVSAQTAEVETSNENAFPPGCSSFFGYSATTGEKCNDIPEEPKSDYQIQIEKIIEEQTKRVQNAPTLNDIKRDSIEQYLTVTSTPQNPKPEEEIKVDVQSNLTNLSKATITWTLNGKIVARGIGEKSFSFKNGVSGKTTRLVVSITTADGESISRELSWNPIGASILWEANTYTPPFYKGKALMTPQAEVRAIVIPDTNGSNNSLSAGNFVYNWKKDDFVISNASGYNKNTFTFQGPKPYALLNVKVQISPLIGSGNSEISINIPSAKPFILFYENDPLQGILYNKTLSSTITLSKKELSLSAEPYFFSPNRAENVYSNYSWALNGARVANVTHLLTLRNDSGKPGTSKLSLSVNGVTETFQSASKSMIINFLATESTKPSF